MARDTTDRVAFDIADHPRFLVIPRALSSRQRALLVLVLLLAPVAACEHFTDPEAPPQASGPIPAGAGRIRVENTLSAPIVETWYAPCLGNVVPLKVRRTIRQGESTLQDVTAGCTRVTMYRDGGAVTVSVSAEEGVITTVRS